MFNKTTFLVLSILANTFSFGATDALGWTDSSQYQGWEYDASRLSANIARGATTGAATAGLGTLAAGGSTAAQVGYGTVLAANAATGGYQVGSGINSVADGNYLTGAGQIIGGGLSIAGSISGAKAITPKPLGLGTDPTQAPPGTVWRGQPGSVPGSEKGSYYNPTTGESFRPDLNHDQPIGPHWDYQRRGEPGAGYRIFLDGRIEPNR